jgi:hypothetical protein
MSGGVGVLLRDVGFLGFVLVLFLSCNKGESLIVNAKWWMNGFGI